MSAARLREVRTDFPFPSQDPVTRVTASAAYHVSLGASGIWATTIAYGVNHAREIVSGGVLDATSAAALIETSVTISSRHTMFGRVEAGAMPAHHLHAHEYFASIFAVGKLQFGYVRHLRVTKGMMPGIGGTASLSLVPPELAPRYSGRTAPSVGVFFSLQAAKHQM